MFGRSVSPSIVSEICMHYFGRLTMPALSESRRCEVRASLFEKPHRTSQVANACHEALVPTAIRNGNVARMPRPRTAVTQRLREPCARARACSGAWPAITRMPIIAGRFVPMFRRPAISGREPRNVLRTCIALLTRELQASNVSESIGWVLGTISAIGSSVSRYKGAADVHSFNGGPTLTMPYSRCTSSLSSGEPLPKYSPRFSRSRKNCSMRTAGVNPIRIRPGPVPS